MKSIEKLLVALASLALVELCSAQVILAGWNMNGVSEAQSSLAATVVSNISTANGQNLLTRGGGAASPGSPASNVFGASGFTATSLSDAITGGDYFSFVVAPVAGYQITLTEVSYLMSRTSSGPGSAALFSSIGGFSAGSELASYPVATTAGGGDHITPLTSFVGISSAVEFRIYAWGGSTGSTDKLRFRDLSSNAGNDIVIRGTVSAIPEPESMTALVALPVLLIGVLKTRRTRSLQSAKALT